MRKGDLRKKQILETAEKLFCEKGYEKTSVQDILDILGLSKGSFYHHYESKELVLRSICDQKAFACAEQYEKNSGSFHGISAINEAFKAAIPFKGEGRTFLTMLLPVFSLAEGKSIRTEYQESIHKAYLPFLIKALEKAYAEHIVYYQESVGTASICLDLINDLWAKTCDLLFKTDKIDKGFDMGEIIQLTDTYRFTIESMLNAPYGSLELMNLNDLNEMMIDIRCRILYNTDKKGGLP